MACVCVEPLVPLGHASQDVLPEWGSGWCVSTGLDNQTGRGNAPLTNPFLAPSHVICENAWLRPYTLHYTSNFSL